MREISTPVPGFIPSSGKAFGLPERIVVNDEALTPEANFLADELAGSVPRPEVRGGAAAEGDLVLRLGVVDGVDSPQGYSLVIDDVATITAPTRQGVFYGTRTLLDLLAGPGGAPAGRVVDEPAVEVRALHVDAARKYFSPAWFHALLDRMAELRLNELQLHFSENEGFRIASDSHPEIVSDEHLSKDEVRGIIEAAARRHIDVVPALDVPGHMAQALRAHPEWAAAQTEEGLRILDYSREEVRAFVLELIDEYAELFPSSAWHLGGDEVFDLLEDPVEGRFPQLHGYAQEFVGPDATLMDGYLHYLNTVAEYLHGKGKAHVRAWNDALYTPGTTVSLLEDVDVAYWTKWHPGMPTVEAIKAHGHRLLNYHDAYFYYVLTTPDRAHFRKPEASPIEADWTPGVFPGPRGVGSQVIAEDDPALLGASFAIWCDVPEMETEAEVMAGIEAPLRAMARKSWRGAGPAA